MSRVAFVGMAAAMMVAHGDTLRERLAREGVTVVPAEDNPDAIVATKDAVVIADLEPIIPSRWARNVPFTQYERDQIDAAEEKRARKNAKRLRARHGDDDGR